MRWLRACTLIVSIGLGVSILALVVHTFWMASQASPPLLGQSVQDLQILVIILLALSSLYTVVFLFTPTVSDQILRQQADQTVAAVKAQLQTSLEEFRGLIEESRRLMLGNETLVQQSQCHPPAVSSQVAESPKAGGPGAGLEYAQPSGNLRVVDKELVKIYQALATPQTNQDNSSAISYLNRAIGLTSDPVAAAELHYTLGCLLGREGELEEALREVQMAFLNESPELEQKLANDTEEGGPLYELANREPYDQVILDLLMDVKVGA